MDMLTLDFQWMHTLFLGQCHCSFLLKGHSSKFALNVHNVGELKRHKEWSK